MLKPLLVLFIVAGSFGFAHAQVATDSTQQKTIAKNRTTSETDSLQVSLEKAAVAAEKAAGRIKNAVENNADKLAKVSQPYIESLMVSAAGLLEKLANELDKAIEEKPKTEKKK